MIHGGLHTNASKASATFGEFTHLIFLIQQYTDPQTNVLLSSVIVGRSIFMIPSMGNM